MISFKELIKDYTLADIPLSHQINIQELLKRVNVLRLEWNKPMVVTSGYRTMYDHLRIYSVLNEKRAKSGLPTLRIPMSSLHLKGSAIDIYDPDLSLTKWLKENDSKRLVDVGLWAEEGNKNWVHLQTFPPKSGKRWFLP